MSLHEQINNICTYIYQSCLGGKEKRQPMRTERLYTGFSFHYFIFVYGKHCLSSTKPQTVNIWFKSFKIKLNYTSNTLNILCGLAVL